MHPPRRRAAPAGVLAALLAMALVATLGAPAWATHESICLEFPYTPDGITNETGLKITIATAQLGHDTAMVVVTALEEIANDILQIADKQHEAGMQALTKLAIPAAAIAFGLEDIARQVAQTIQLVAKVARGALAFVVTPLIAVTKGLLLAVQYQNNLAQECRVGEHWYMQDVMLKAAIRRDLSVTTTPVVLFVLPVAHRGYIDRPDVGVSDVVAATLAQLKATGQCSCSTAQSYYNSAVSQMNAGNYKSAYKLFRQAYVSAFNG